MARSVVSSLWKTAASETGGVLVLAVLLIVCAAPSRWICPQLTSYSAHLFVELRFHARLVNILLGDHGRDRPRCGANVVFTASFDVSEGRWGPERC